MVADGAIVRHMRVRHQEIVRSDNGLRAGLIRAVKRDVLAKNIVVADAQPRQLAFVFQILGRVPDDATGVKMVVRANFRFAGQINVRPDDAIRAQFDAGINHGIRPDTNACSTSMPLIPGMRISSSTMSGACCRIESSAWGPSSASSTSNP